jgi:Putative lumazine-binding
MRFYIFLITITLIFTACGGGTETPKTNGNSTKPSTTTVTNSGTNTNQLPTNSPNINSPETVKKPDAPKVNEAQTLASVVSAYGEALKTKNDAALRKVLSTETIKGWEEEMKSEGKTKLAEYLASSEVQDGKIEYEVRNEEVKGDDAVAEIKGGSFGVWSKIRFVKENGEWKITNDSPEIDDVKNAANKAQQIVK